MGRYDETQKLHRAFIFVILCGCLLLHACAPRLDRPNEASSLTQTTEMATTLTIVPTPLPSPTYLGPVSRVEGKTLLVRNKIGSFEPYFIKGVNIGAAKPGYWPGEFGITQEDYSRWFQWIGEMNANTIRVYVPQMPSFYNALLAYNLRVENPLYLLQGVYMNEELIETHRNAFYPELLDIFYRDIANTIDIIHGNAHFEKLPGNAGGEYSADVSEYVIGYLPGIEFTADFVLGTNEQNPGKNAFSGTYVVTENASAFEVFLAEAQEYMIDYEQSRYNVQRPIAITNWITTDPLSHPGEPNPGMEDAVSVDVEHIKSTAAYTAGFFASYHVYPYYPDLMSYDPAYISGENPNPYLSYLTKLNSYHTMPVLIAEFGIPTSRGKTHENTVTGFDQGNIDETTQGVMLTSMMNDIRSADCMGGLIFSWQDEWFKRTWNTTDQEETERRPYWHSVESPEKCFGLLAFDPGETLVVKIDGKTDDWSERDVVSEYDGVRLSVQSDETYLYFKVDLGALQFGQDTIYIAADTIPNQGNRSFGAMQFASGADFLIQLHGENDSVMLVDPYYDVFQYQYAVQTALIDPIDHQTDLNSGTFVSLYAAMSRPLVLPSTGEIIPFSRFDAGKLAYGISDPDNPAFNSLADFFAMDSVIELRIPWLLFNVRDPGTKNIIADWNKTGLVTGQTIESFSFAVCSDQSAGSVPFGTYTWESWDLPTYHERLKKSYPIVQSMFADIP